jgi:DNA-binding LacI/PurR family transcriptional regulator
MLRDPRHSVVVVDHDFSSYGIPSIRIFQPVFIHQLLNHLESLGHTRIGCFNTQPEDSEVRERVDQWRFWMAIHGFSGRLVNSCVPPGGDVSSHAYETMDKILSEKHNEETAWFFITAPAAIGAMRAMHDHGIMPGKDISTCTANGEGFLASMSHPRLTALQSSDPVPFITYCLDWIAKGHKAWEGPLLMQPAEVPLVIGESTRQARTSAVKLPVESQPMKNFNGLKNETAQAG